MRRAIISGIHANLEALKALQADLREQHVDEIVCLGDILGYGPNPVECVDWVRKHCKWSLAGAHDIAVVHELKMEGNPLAQKTVASHRVRLQPKGFFDIRSRLRWRFLRRLRCIRQKGQSLFCHGCTPWKANARAPSKQVLIAELETFLITYQLAPKGPPQERLRLDGLLAQAGLVFTGNDPQPGVQVISTSQWHSADTLQHRRWEVRAENPAHIQVGWLGRSGARGQRTGYVIHDTQSNLIHFVQLPGLESNAGTSPGGNTDDGDPLGSRVPRPTRPPMLSAHAELDEQM